MNHDLDYLREYAASGSEEAFTHLVNRYLSLVYAAALRRVGGDVHRAEDVTQMVFTALARNASSRTKHPDLAGWLFTTTRFLAGKATRGERRRALREQAIHIDQPIMSVDAANPAPDSLHVVLDDVMMELRQLDRQMLLLRFHRGLRLAEIGAQLGATENAVQKRLDRALDQLKEKLARRGITSTAAALVVAFEQQSALAVPAGLAGASLSAALACGTGASGLLAVSSFMMLSKLQIGIAAAVAVATSASLVWEVRENAELRSAVASQSASAAADVLGLQKQLAALTQRATAAEADAAKLEQALQAARTASSIPPARPRVVTNNPDEQALAAVNHAAKLAQQGKPQEALEEYLICYRSLEGPRGTLGQQLVMSGLKKLGETYLPAVSALRDLRDTALRKLQANPGTRELVSEVALLNERLGDGRASMALYDTLPAGDPGRQALAAIARDSFVQERRYADALVGTSFGMMLGNFERMAQSSRPLVIKGALTNIEVLVGAGKLDDAKVMTEKLLAFDSSDATRAAIKAHTERAGQVPAP